MEGTIVYIIILAILLGLFIWSLVNFISERKSAKAEGRAMRYGPIVFFVVMGGIFASALIFFIALLLLLVAIMTSM
ncbi:MAG: hypothetical protein J5685_02695 [Clostridiales bacterium]|nr:hypothetical protein [Clostridiales bacterium]